MIKIILLLLLLSIYTATATTANETYFSGYRALVDEYDSTIAPTSEEPYSEVLEAVSKSYSGDEEKPPYSGENNETNPDRSPYSQTPANTETAAPTTKKPSPKPTHPPTRRPTLSPTRQPTSNPTESPTNTAPPEPDDQTVLIASVSGALIIAIVLILMYIRCRRTSMPGTVDEETKTLIRTAPMTKVV